MTIDEYLSTKEGYRTSLFNNGEAFCSQTSAGTVSPCALVAKWQFSAVNEPSVKVISLDTSSGAIIGSELSRTHTHDEEFTLAYDSFSVKPDNWRFKDDHVGEVRIRISFYGLLVGSEYQEAVRHRVTEIPHRVMSLSNALAVQRAKNKAAISLLERWLADESGYDEVAWPKIKRSIEEHRLSDRRRFNE